MSGLRRQEIQALYICIIFLITLRGVISKHHHGHQSNEEETVGETVKFSPEFKYSCVYENVTYQGGHKFRPDPCTYCRCPRLGGRPRCAIQDCYQEPSCVEYHKPADECCGVCIQYGCLHSDGKSYPPGAVVLKSACERCICPEEGGRTVCEKVACPDVTCVNPIQEEGECCHTCPDGPNCWLDDRILQAGETVTVSRCKKCHCPETPLHNAWSSSSSEDNGPRAICTLDDCE